VDIAEQRASNHLLFAQNQAFFPFVTTAPLQIRDLIIVLGVD
jgi:hypothetical protein